MFANNECFKSCYLLNKSLKSLKSFVQKTFQLIFWTKYYIVFWICLKFVESVSIKSYTNVSLNSINSYLF